MAELDPRAFNEFEAAGWNRNAEAYEDFFGDITSRVVEALLDAVGVGSSTRLLDVATGPGVVAAAAARRGAQVVGLDVAEAMLELARERHPGLEFVKGDAETLPFGDGSFDAVAANFAVLHLGVPESAAAEFARVLVPGGRAGVTMWDEPGRARFIGVFTDAVAESGAGPPPGVPPGPPVFRFSDEAELRALLEGAGLERVEIETIGFSLQLGSPDELWSGMMGGTVRTAAMVLEHPAGVQERIRSAFDRLVEGYRDGSGVSVPVSVKLASAAKPG